MPDIFEDVKRSQEVANRPKMPTPIPPGLRNEYSNAPYSLAAPKKSKPKSDEEKSKPKSDEEKSLEWNAAQRKVAEGQ